MPTHILSETVLAAQTDLAAELMSQIQAIVNNAWEIDTTIGDGTLSGSPNNLNYSYTQTYEDYATIVPGIPAYTITEAETIPAVVIPGTPSCCTVNTCPPWSCKVGIPGTPAETITEEYIISAVVSPAVPALKGGYSTELDLSASVVGVSEALNPLFSSITFKGSQFDQLTSSGEFQQSFTYNLDEQFTGTAIQISGRAAFDDLKVDIGGAVTNFGNISTGTMNMGNMPDIPLEFDATIVIPSFDDDFEIIGNSDNGGEVSYNLFPQASSVRLSNLEISTGVTALADFIDDYLLDYLTDFWNVTIVPLFTAVGADAPKAPSESLSEDIQEDAELLQEIANEQGQLGANEMLTSLLDTIQPYIQPITTTAWNYGTYPILYNSNYANAIMNFGLFPGVDAAYSSYIGANLSTAIFSDSNLKHSDFTDANLSYSIFSNAELYGSDFTNANLTGTVFTGASGSPTTVQSSNAKVDLAGSSVKTRTQSEQTVFDHAVLFGADFRRTDFDLNGAFYDSNTKFGRKFDPNKEGLRYFSSPLFIVSNKKLLRNYGLEYRSVKGHFILDTTCKESKRKPGLRADVLTGKLKLNNFDADDYRDSLPKRVADRLVSYQGNLTSEYNQDEIIAVYKILDNAVWTRHNSAEYLMANPRLIQRLGGVKKSMRKARNYYLSKGIFKDHSLKPKDTDYESYVQKYPSVVADIGGIIDYPSLAYHFVTHGYSEGQIL